MNKKFAIIFYLICVVGIILLFQSCATTKRNLVYFSNLPDSTEYSEAIENQIHPTIEPGDAIAVKITTINPEANILFNSGSLPMNNFTTGVSSGVTETAALPQGYIVDDNGQINLPVIGKIKLDGLTKEQAQIKIADEVSKSAKNAIVNIIIQNFKVTVIGEVAHPGIFTIPNNRINVLEAIGMAGDMTPYAIRKNVVIIREKNGKRTVHQLDFNNKDLLNSNYYNLEQNDVVYVRPENRLKAAQANNGDYRLWSIILSGVSVISLVLSRVL